MIKDKNNSSDLSVALDSKELNINGYLIFSCIVAALAAFNSGFNTGVANIPEATIRKCGEVTVENGFPDCLPASDLVWGVVIGLFALGGGFGGLSASKLLSWLGRRNSLLLNNVFFIVGGVLLGTATTLAQMGVGRFLVGVGSGIASVGVSTYIGEIATNKCRGAMGAVLQFMMVVGILFAQGISIPLNSSPGWRVLFAITAVPAILQLVLFPMCVETPRYLVSVRNMEKAKENLEKLRRGYNIENEFNEIVEGQYSSPKDDTNDLPLDQSTDVNPFMQLFKDKVLFRHLTWAVVIHAAQQFSGINGVIFYSTSIFEKTFGSENAPYVTLGVAVLNLIVTILSVFLIDRLGRKFLLLLSLLGMCIFSVLIVIGSVYLVDILVVVSVLLFVASFAIGLGPIPWLIISEIFPTKPLAAASAIAMGVNWFCNFAVGLLFPTILSGLGDYTFVIFAVITFASAIFIFSFIPETKGRTIEEILASSYAS
ncbi:general substrate transporter, partial [Neoconidiobolus thromboides FSU 785]